MKELSVGKIIISKQGEESENYQKFKELIKDRKIMSNDGILVVIINVDMKKRELLIKPNITTRGFILVNENEELIHKIENKAEQTIQTALSNPKSTFATLKSDITDALYPLINNLTGRKPIILPVIIDIKREKNIISDNNND